MRLIRWISISVIFLFVGYVSIPFLLTHLGTYLVYENYDNQPVDAVVVLSGFGASRVDASIPILKEYPNAYLVFTGGPIFDTSFPQLMGAYIRKKDVQVDKLFLEEASYSTRDHPLHLIDFIQTHHIKSLVIVTSDFHTRRSYYIFKEVLADYYPHLMLFVKGAPDGIDYTVWWKYHDMLELIGFEWIKFVYYSLFYF